jgi:hypothetical protein
LRNDLPENQRATTIAVTVAGFSFIEVGDLMEFGGELRRVTAVVGSTYTMRKLRWYETAWHNVCDRWRRLRIEIRWRVDFAVFRVKRRLRLLREALRA